MKKILKKEEKIMTSLGKYHYIQSRKIQMLKIVTISVTNIKTQKKEASTIKNLKKNLQKVRS